MPRAFERTASGRRPFTGLRTLSKGSYAIALRIDVFCKLRPLPTGLYALLMSDALSAHTTHAHAHYHRLSLICELLHGCLSYVLDEFLRYVRMCLG